MFENVFWDRELFGINRKDNDDLYDVIKIVRFPLFWITSKLSGEYTHGILNLYSVKSVFEVIFNASWTTILVMVILMIMLIHRG